MKNWGKLLGLLWLLVGAGALAVEYREHAGKWDPLWGEFSGVMSIAVAIPFIAGAAEIEKKASLRLVVTALLIRTQLRFWSTDSSLVFKVLLSVATLLILYKAWWPRSHRQTETPGSRSYLL